MDSGTIPLELSADPLLRDLPEVDGCKVLEPCLIRKRLGHGGMGVVYRGRHRHLEIDVAVKCLRPEIAAAHPSAVTRFVQEARLCSRLSHPNLVRVLDMRHEGPIHYIVMEYVEGETARARVNRKGPLSVVEATSIVAAAARGLGYAHENGVVHRDVKPDNILISRKGEVKVSDLGLGKDLGSEAGLTSAGGMLGTPQYMAPEQYDDPRSVGPPADVYGLGATLVFLLTGQDPIPAGEVAMVMRRACSDPFPAVLAGWSAVIPEAMASIVRSATRPEASQRFPSAGELARVLEEHLAGIGAQAKEAVQDGVERGTVSPPPLMSKGFETSAQTRARWRRLSGERIQQFFARAVLIGGISALVAWFLFRPPAGLSSPPNRLLHVETGMVLVLVDGSTLRAGSGAETTMAPFYLGETEVTNEQYRRFRRAHRSGSVEGQSLDGDEQPVVGVSARDADAYCENYGLRLPAEAEWELACRGRITGDYPWGSDPDDPAGARYANIHNEGNNQGRPVDRKGVVWDDGYFVTSPVGIFQPDFFGLHDMIGNVMEWCSDVVRIDGVRHRPVRGGSWGSSPDMCRIDARVLKSETFREQHIGFRVGLGASSWNEQGFSALPESGQPGH